MAEEMDIEEGDLDMDGGMMEMPNLFWNMTVNPDGDNEIEEPEVPGWVIHITHACFGPNVKAGSRTVLISQHDDNGDVKEAPLCVLLEGKNENVRLDLLFSEPAKFILQGKNPSPVSLTGFLQPPPGFGDETQSMMGDDLAEIEDDEEEAQIQDLIRKRKLSQAKKDAQDDEAPQLIKDKPQEPPAKRAKTEAGNKQKNTPKDQKDQKNIPKDQKNTPKDQKDQNKNKKNANKNKKKNDKNNENNTTSPNVEESKEEAEKATEEKQTSNDVNDKTPKESEKTEKSDEKPTENKNKKQDKQDKPDKMQNMKGGIQYKDLKQGEGAPIQNGQKVRVYYVGQLDDKTIFDKVIAGQPFEFEYGKGSVVKGWDLGMKGMKVGGKRRIVIPPKLGYAEQATEKIPANSPLTYTIEIKSAN